MTSVKWAAYVMYVNRPDLLARAVASFPLFTENLTVVDNSPLGWAEDAERWEQDHGTELLVFENCRNTVGVMKPAVPMTYSQSLNWILLDAQRQSAALIAHFHADAFTTNLNAASHLLARACADLAAGKRICCWYTLHDLLWMVNVEALADIGGCDITFPSYFTDGCLRVRWEKAGWERVVTGIEGVGHEGSATINSDPKLRALNAHTFHHYAALYEAKFGGPPGAETFDYPYNDPELDWRP